MTLLAPLWLVAGIAGAIGVLALHFIARQRPSPMLLPTARFVPDRPARAARRAPRPTDLVLLALRALSLLALGLAFAGPVWGPARVPLLRVVMLDRSAAAAGDSVTRAARSILRPGDVLVPFDTTPRTIVWAPDDSLPAVSGARGDLAAALLVGMREAAHRMHQADSAELVLISPVDASTWNTAVLPIRDEWPGRITVVRTPTTQLAASGVNISLRGDDGDPLAATLALLGNGNAAGAPVVRVLRGDATGADTAWVRDSGGSLVLWPRRRSEGDATPSRDAGSGAVMTNEVVAVAPWTRSPVPTGRPVAWWADGAPAAAASRLGDGCVRAVGIGVPEAGDVALARSTQRLVRSLAAPCDGTVQPRPVADSLVRRLAGAGPLAAAGSLARAGAGESAATPWLLGAALVLLAAEWILRRRVRDA